MPRSKQHILSQTIAAKLMDVADLLEEMAKDWEPGDPLSTRIRAGFLFSAQSYRKTGAYFNKEFAQHVDTLARNEPSGHTCVHEYDFSTMTCRKCGYRLGVDAQQNTD